MSFLRCDNGLSQVHKYFSNSLSTLLYMYAVEYTNNTYPSEFFVYFLPYKKGAKIAICANSLVYFLFNGTGTCPTFMKFICIFSNLYIICIMMKKQQANWYAHAIKSRTYKQQQSFKCQSYVLMAAIYPPAKTS